MHRPGAHSLLNRWIEFPQQRSQAILWVGSLASNWPASGDFHAFCDCSGQQ
jgi:hypothetical protein